MDVLEELLPLLRGHGEQWLRKNYPGPFLLRQRTEEEIRSGPSRAVGLTCLPGQLRPVDPENMSRELAELDAESDLVDRYQLYTIAKSGRNVFANGITIGRAKNNDVVVPLTSVSKFHAWLQPENGQFLAYDARSRFGTFVNGGKAPPEGDRGLPILPGDELRLGDVPLTFMDVSHLYRWILEQRKRRNL